MSQPSFNPSSFDRARIEWTLRGGASSLARIHSTLKHLRSELSFDQVHQSVEHLVAEGALAKQAHPVREGEFFYALAGEA